MEEKNELNDIILNKGGSSSSNKKIILAVATLGVILIIVVMLMNTLTSSGTDNLPQAVLPPEPQKELNAQNEEPLFEDVPIVQESAPESTSLDEIAQKLKEESTKENLQTTKDESVEAAPIAPKVVETKKVPTSPKTSTPATSGEYYIQVGSFAKYEPNKKFLDSILNLGYKYKFHKVTVNSKTLNKVLVGPFHNEAEARKALAPIRKSVETGAFLVII